MAPTHTEWDSNGRQGKRLVIAMVGLPGRGKSYTASKLARYLKWLHYKVRVFNFGAYRRQYIGSQKRASFYDPYDKDSAARRDRMADIAMNDLLEYITQESGEIGILDATNTTLERRQNILRFVRENIPNAVVMWVESICNDEKVLETSIREVKAKHPDYDGVDPEKAVTDFRARIAQYKKVYVPVNSDPSVDEGSHIKLIDAGVAISMRKVSGALSTKLAGFLMNLRPMHKTRVFLTRHGESVYNMLGRIGGDSNLSRSGRKFGLLLGGWMTQTKRAGKLLLPGEDEEDDPQLQQQWPQEIWHSPLTRSRETARLVRQKIVESMLYASPRRHRQSVHTDEKKKETFDDGAKENEETKRALSKSSLEDDVPPEAPKLLEFRALRDIDVGICDSMTVDEIEELYPEEFEARKFDKLRYRYPNGESYLDVIQRLEPIILELERCESDRVLIIAHRALLRCILAYFLDTKHADVPYMEIPLHCVTELSHDRTGKCVALQCEMTDMKRETEGQHEWSFEGYRRSSFS